MCFSAKHFQIGKTDRPMFVVVISKGLSLSR
jgi:hypothetical protein